MSFIRSMEKVTGAVITWPTRYFNFSFPSQCWNQKGEPDPRRTNLAILQSCITDCRVVGVVNIHGFELSIVCPAGWISPLVGRAASRPVKRNKRRKGKMAAIWRSYSGSGWTRLSSSNGLPSHVPSAGLISCELLINISSYLSLSLSLSRSYLPSCEIDKRFDDKDDPSYM